MLNINNLRQEYRLKSLDIVNLNPDPFLQFHLWFKEAQQAQVAEPNALTLATASAEGRPSSRTILLKGMDEKGFLFFTNYQSRKGRDLSVNPFGCMTFYWAELERQAILDGSVEKISQDESEAYFASRPRSSQLGSWASHQDQTIGSREELETAYRNYEKKFEGKLVPKPLTGEDIGCFRFALNTGKGAKIVCTTAFGTFLPTVLGKSSG